MTTMHTSAHIVAALVLLVFLPHPARAEDRGPALWSIGQADNSTAEFAHAPADYRDYNHPGFFVVGQSDAKHDWPYVQPGVIDGGWAPGGPQEFEILFSLKKAPTRACRFVLDFVDTHSSDPPRLTVDINGHTSSHQMPKGAGDASVFGNPAKGREHVVGMDVPPEALKAGDNRISITTTSGSWVLWDSLRFEAPKDVELAATEPKTILGDITPQPVLVRHNGKLLQPVVIDILHVGKNQQVSVQFDDEPTQSFDLKPGRQTLEALYPSVEQPTAVTMRIRMDKRLLAEKQVEIEPVRRWVVYLLHNTHLDIGFTHTQEHVEQRQIEFFDRALELIAKTDDYPTEARFIWQPEGLWPVESYLKQASEEKRAAFIKAARAERIGLDALYGNALTGLYNDEELFALVDYAVRLREKHGIPLESATITDVPGLTWGVVPVLAQSGVKYFSISPNVGHRVGHTHVQDDQPFYWVSPCGQHKLLCWQTGRAYSWLFGGFKEQSIVDYLTELEKSSYPYDFVQSRYTVGGDNGHPDPRLPDQVKAWNERYAYPKLVIASTSQMFRDFENRYGDQIPVLHGDFTPYWEDGAASTSADTATCRRATETLIQSQTLWAMLKPGSFPDDQFYAAWRNAVLYDEHTWGAHNSISQPDSDFAKAQAAHKKGFALTAAKISQTLMNDVAAKRRASEEPVRAVEVFNTLSWPRTDLVVLPKEMPLVGDRVTTADGKDLASQRLATGELAFLAEELPPLGSARFLIEPGKPTARGAAHAEDRMLRNDHMTVNINEKTGAINRLKAAGIKPNLAQGRGLNEYIYVAGRDPANQQFVNQVNMSILDSGPLVATVRIESAAPGARTLIREVRLTDRLNRLDISNVIDKLPVRKKEGVHFGFDFNVPEPDVHMDMPWAVIRPEADQIDGACRNFYAVERWVDVSNVEFGLSLATIDAPLVQIGAIRTDVGHHFRPEVWLKHIDPSSTLFSYVMNNYWETNYKADQQGPTTFRYAIRPHTRQYHQIEAMRFGIERSRPLVVIPAKPDGPGGRPSLLTVDNPGVIVTSVKPSRDGKATIVRLYAASGEPEKCRLNSAESKTFFYSDPSENRGRSVDGLLNLAAYEIATLRLE